MNQQDLAASVFDRLGVAARRDRMEWLPAVGWMRPGGDRYGLALDLLREKSTRRQLDVLAKVLFRLAVNDEISVAEFRRPAGDAQRLGEPLGTNQAPYSLAGPGSQPLRVDGPREYGVRLPA